MMIMRHSNEAHSKYSEDTPQRWRLFLRFVLKFGPGTVKERPCLTSKSKRLNRFEHLPFWLTAENSFPLGPWPPTPRQECGACATDSFLF